PSSRSYFVAKRLVTTQYRQGNLNQDSIANYARQHRFDEVQIGLSLLSSLPVDVIERAVMDRNREMILVLCKALDFSWIWRHHKGPVDPLLAQGVFHLRERDLLERDSLGIAAGRLDPGPRVEPDHVVAGVDGDALALEILAGLDSGFAP
ncbi:DUF2336 domain-containing protein, partial [Pseudomonas sp. EL_65y_Pfl2_R96]|uniref:DUF2336 domain-containing protein n=1 Tax=Pseudomonas sp. EL_65y_Pfl2_R96 TaxID=3088699 RepID=UPI0030D9B7DA